MMNEFLQNDVDYQSFITQKSSVRYAAGGARAAMVRNGAQKPALASSGSTVYYSCNEPEEHCVTITSVGRGV